MFCTDDLDRYAPEVADVLHSATANLKRSGRGYSRKALVGNIVSTADSVKRSVHTSSA